MLQGCAVISASFSSMEHLSAAQCPQLHDLPELQVKELCRTGDHPITHWGISCSLEQFWPQGVQLEKETAARSRYCSPVTQRVQILDFLKAQEGLCQNTAYVCNSKPWVAARSNPAAIKPQFSCKFCHLCLCGFFFKTQNRTWNTT